MPDDDWKRETMWDLRTDSPYYWEMQETLRDHYREMAQLEADERADALADLYDDEDDEDDEDPDDLDDPRNDPRRW